jgi:glycosyltransferase involved in cell wall biosynthesis
VLEDGATALLVPVGDHAALARAIARLHADPDLRRHLSENARRLQQAQYSLERMTERYLAVYREALLDFANVTRRP